MAGEALGLLEVVGLAAACAAADAAVKTAAVELTGWELSKGSGMITVKITGEVGAVMAAVQAGAAAASQVSTVYATKVMPRPAKEIEDCFIG